MNDIGRVSLKVHQPLVWDSYQRNHATGSFIVIDEANNNTIAAGNPLLDLQGKRVFVPAAVNNTDLDTFVVTQPMKLADGIATIMPAVIELISA